jgi:hypothetical protein
VRVAPPLEGPAIECRSPWRGLSQATGWKAAREAPDTDTPVTRLRSHQKRHGMDFCAAGLLNIPFAAADGQNGKSDDEIRIAMGDRFRKHIVNTYRVWLR